MGKHVLGPLYDLVHHLFGLRPIHQEMITLAGLRDGHRVLRPDGLLILADAVLEEHGHGHTTGWGRRQIGTRGRMREQLRDNVGHAVAQRIAAAGFTVGPTRPMALRIGGKVGIELARPNRPRSSPGSDKRCRT